MHTHKSKGWLESAFSHVFGAIEHSLFAEDIARREGLMQSLDPRVKVIGLGLLIVTSIALHRIAVVALLLVLAAILGAFSHLSLRFLATRIWTPVLLFSGLIALPAIFLTPGVALWRAPAMNFAITQSGVRAATMLLARAETTATLSMLLVLCTPWTRVLKSFRVLGAPPILVVLLATTYRYIFVLLRTASEMFEARQSRMVGVLSAAQTRTLIFSSTGALMEKSLQLGGDVHLAMLSRGFQGEAQVLDELAFRAQDWIALAAFVLIAIAAFWIGR